MNKVSTKHVNRSIRWKMEEFFQKKFFSHKPWRGDSMFPAFSLCAKPFALYEMVLAFGIYR
jgi:hypothetical protein